MLRKIKTDEQRGIITSDAIVAILIIMLFVGIITSIITNIVLESSKIKINSQQMDFATELMEYAEQLPYEEVTETKLIAYVNSKYDEDRVKAGESIEELDSPYKIAVSVETFIPEDETLPKLDIIKTVTLTIQNTLVNKVYTTTMSTVKRATAEEIEKIL